ncbi:MAG: hypothetical protein ACYTGH_06365 [Planctomycetota bacterium]|jgi:hypothetical protein
MKKLVMAVLGAALIFGGMVQANEEMKALQQQQREASKQLGVIKKKYAKDADLADAKKTLGEATKAFNNAVTEALKANTEAAPLLAQIDEINAKIKELRKNKASKEEQKAARAEMAPLNKQLGAIKKTIYKDPALANLMKAKSEAGKAYNEALNAKLANDPEAGPLLTTIKDLKTKMTELKKAAQAAKKGQKKGKKKE